MRVYVCLLVAVLAMAVPAQALLGVKLALLGALRNGLGGGGIFGGNGNGGGYDGGYGRTYGGGYGNSGYGSVLNYNRPVNTGQNFNHGWGQQSYGGGYNGGYSSGYSGGYSGGNEEVVKVFKVIVNHEQPQAYNNYAIGSSAASASSVSTSSGASWTPLPTPLYSSQPVQSIQASAPALASTPVIQTYSPQPVQTIQVSAPTANDVPVQVPTPVQVIQPPPRPLYVQTPPQTQYIQPLQPAYEQDNAQRPIQYPVQQAIYQQPQRVSLSALRPLPQSQQHIPAQTYGPPLPALAYVAPSGDNTGAWNSKSWNSAGSGSGWGNNIGTGPWKSGSIWESIGC